MKYIVVKNDKEDIITLNGKLEAYLYQKKATFSGEGEYWKDKIEWIAGFMWKSLEGNRDIFKIVDQKGNILRYNRKEFEKLLK